LILLAGLCPVVLFLLGPTLPFIINEWLDWRPEGSLRSVTTGLLIFALVAIIIALVLKEVRTPEPFVPPPWPKMPLN
jgi:hypothetical protein